MKNILEKELETFQSHKQELLGKASGKFVLIKNDKVVAIFESQSDAIAEGYKQFGNVPFLVKQILEIDMPANFYSFKMNL